MKRKVSLEEISDGRLYERNDMVKAGCGGCEGCSACCHHMGMSVILDPLDLHRLSVGLGMEAARLLEGPVELSVTDGMVLPNLKMDGKEEGCRFLSEEGRCRVHTFRPGLCRLFPLGRYYEGERFWYFLQVHECRKKDRTKVKVSRCLDVPDVPACTGCTCIRSLYFQVAWFPSGSSGDFGNAGRKRKGKRDQHSGAAYVLSHSL